MINFNINPPLSQGISRTQPWCHASQHETWPVSCLQGLQDLQGITCPGSTLVPPHLFPAFGSRHGPPGKSIVDRWPGHLTDLWIFIVYIYIWCMRLHCPISIRMSLYVFIIYGIYGGIVGQSHFVTGLSQRSCWGPSTGPSSWAGNSIEPHCHIWSQNVRNIKGPKGPWHVNSHDPKMF